MLSTHIGITVDYYSDMSKSNSHMVAEAALHAMRELVLRVTRSSVVKVLPKILETLRACVQEESWPVRDAAVGALGAVLSTFAFEVRQIEEEASTCESEDTPALFLRVCCKQLLDAIPSVRETAAVALAHICSLRDDVNIRKAAREAVVHHLAAHLDITEAPSKVENPNKMNKTFLPSSMLTASSSSSAIIPPAPPRSDLQRQVAGWRKGGGWGCCLDCMEVRQGSVQDAKEGCLTLFQELPIGGEKLFRAPQPLLKLIASKYPQYLAYFE